MAATRTPDLGKTNGWFNTLEPMTKPRQVKGTVRTDWVVLGAGVTGLSAARHLAEQKPDDRILLIEAERVGRGNSGRNSGFALHAWFHGALDDPAELEHARRIGRLSTGGVEILRRLVRENQIECAWHDFGMLWAAAGSAGDAGVADHAKAFERLGQTAKRLDKARMKAITGSDFYTSGVTAPGTVLMQPAALCRGLARTLPANVTVYEETPVTDIRAGRPIRLTTPDGEVETGNLILTTNTFSPELGFARNRMAPISTYASFTRPLTTDELRHVGEEGPWGILPAARGGSTVRRTSDNRILMRNGFSYIPGKTFDEPTLAAMRHDHAESIAKRWPALAGIEIEHTWGGVLGSTRNQGQIFGKLGDNIWGIIACNGANVSRGTQSGALLVDYIVGKESDLLKDQLSIPQPSWLPPEPILGFFVRRRYRQMASAGEDER